VKTALVYVGAAIGEIAGCFAFWAWLRLGKPTWWLLPGVLSLIAFACLLTLVETSAAGRAYAAYGGIYIVASLFWLWVRAPGSLGYHGSLDLPDRRSRHPLGSARLELAGPRGGEGAGPPSPLNGASHKR